MLQRFSQCLSTLNSPLICPIPLHKNRLAFRGYNQAELLSRPLAQALNIETYTELYRIIETPQQMRIQNKQERISNMLNAFKANSSHSSFQPILLIDDVTTTLSTLQAAAKALQRQGFINIHALVLAH
jgi:ComF family protein